MVVVYSHSPLGKEVLGEEQCFLLLGKFLKNFCSKNVPIIIPSSHLLFFLLECYDPQQ